jgi:hypothetical protein
MVADEGEDPMVLLLLSLLLLQSCFVAVNTWNHFGQRKHACIN